MYLFFFCFFFFVQGTGSLWLQLHLLAQGALLIPHITHCIQCIAMYCNATIVCQQEICKNRFYNYLCDFVFFFLGSTSVKPHTHNVITWSSYSFPGLLCLLFLITYCRWSKTGGKNGLWMRLAKPLNDYTLHMSICSGCVSHTSCFYMHAQTMQVQIYLICAQIVTHRCTQIKFKCSRG